MTGEDVGIITLIVFGGTSTMVHVRAIAKRIEAGVESIALPASGRGEQK